MKIFIKWGFCFCLVFLASLMLFGCGGNEITSLSVTVRNADEYSYNSSTRTLTFQNGVDVPSFVNEDMFSVFANYSQSGKIEVETFECQVMRGSNNADYIIRLSYENKHLDLIAKVTRQELTFFSNITQKNLSQNTFTYSGESIYYSGDEVDIANLILDSNGNSLNYLIANGYKAQIGNGIHKSTDANIQNYSYTFALIANEFCYWNFSNKKVDTIYIEWQIKPREITISLPSVNLWSVAFSPNSDGSGKLQGPEFTLGMNDATYFDLSEDALSLEKQRDVGAHLWRINLKEEYQNSNYKFIYSGQRENNLSLMEFGTPYNVSTSSILTLGIKWQITKYVLPISSIDFVNSNLNAYSKYYDKIDGVAHYRYDENGIYPLTNITTNNLENFFPVDNITKRVYQIGTHSVILSVREGLVLSNYEFSSGENLQTSYTLQFSVDGKEYSLPTGFDATSVELVSISVAEPISISDYLYQVNSSSGYVSPLQYYEATVYVFDSGFPEEMLESGYYFELEDSEQMLVIGNNNVNIIYYYNRYHEGITLNCNLTLFSQE